MTSIYVLKNALFNLKKLKGVFFLYLKDAIKEFIYELQIRNYSKRTVKEYQNDLKRFLMYLKDNHDVEELEEVSSIHIKQYLSDKKEVGVKMATLNTYLKHLKVFFNYCYQEEYCMNVAKRIRRAKEPKTVIKTFNDLEVAKMISAYNFSDYMNARNKVIITMLMDTGIRNTELCLIKIEDIKSTTILIHGKGNKERVVPVSPILKKAMIRYERIREKHLKNKDCIYDNYFLSSRYKQLTDCSIDRVIKQAGKVAEVRSEIRVSAHTFRHWYAQTQLKNGLDIYSLSRVLGHESVNITRIYLQGVQDDEIIKSSIKTSPLMNLKVR